VCVCVCVSAAFLPVNQRRDSVKLTEKLYLSINCSTLVISRSICQTPWTISWTSQTGGQGEEDEDEVHDSRG
jgi:hypothetical protein